MVWKILYFWFILDMIGCMHEEKTLDIAMLDKPNSNDRILVTRTPAGVSGKRVLEWQQFFKKEPEISERNLLRKRIEELSKSSQLNIDQLLELARNSRSIGELAKAEVYYRQILRKHPHHLDAHIEIAQVYLQTKSIEYAFDYLAAAKKILEGQEQARKIDLYKYRYTLALGLLRSNRVAEARTILSDLIEAKKDFILAYTALAHSYLKENKEGLAEFIAKRGMEQIKNHAPLLNIIGIAHEHRGMLTKAKTYYNKALELDPNLAAALVNRANIAARRGEHEAAESDINKAIALSPYDANSYISLAVLYRKSGRYSSAKQMLQKALDINPENAFARYNLASLYAKEFSDINTALRLYYEVLQAGDYTEEIRELARIQIQGLRDSRIQFEK